jgi:N-methylhydantoinase A
VAIGGNGGIHALEVARDLGIRRVVVAAARRVFSASMLASDLEHIALDTVTRFLDTLTNSDLKRHEATSRSRRDAPAGSLTGSRAQDTSLAWEADLRHEGQATERDRALRWRRAD